MTSALVVAGMAAAGIVYAIASVLLFSFGLNLVTMALTVWRRPVATVTHCAEPADRQWPSVTVQLPVFNERYVARRAIDAACSLSYPGRLVIQVLDDSTDDTTAQVDAGATHAIEQGHDVRVIRRRERIGYKAGALAAGLEVCDTDLVAVFDADFVPDPSFLVDMVPDLDEPDVAFAQARWTHLNEHDCALTRLQALAIDAHFTVEQAARGVRGHWFNFNGTCGVWQRAAIEDAGGWTADTLTEDLDLSYRAHLRGWRGVFRDDIAVPGEIPTRMSAFRRQQHRWARGSIECARKLLGPVWRSDARIGVKLQATAHLLAYGVHLLLLTLTLLYPAVVFAGAEHESLRRAFGLAVPLALASIAPAAFLLTGQHRLGRPVWRALPRVVALVLVGSGLMVNSARAVLDIWRRPNAGFERTPKLGSEGGSERGWARTGYGHGLDRAVWAEMAIGSYALAGSWYAAQHGTWGVALYSLIFATSLLVVASVTLAQFFDGRRVPAPVRRRVGSPT